MILGTAPFWVLPVHHVWKFLPSACIIFVIRKSNWHSLTQRNPICFFILAFCLAQSSVESSSSSGFKDVYPTVVNNSRFLLLLSDSVRQAKSQTTRKMEIKWSWFLSYWRLSSACLSVPQSHSMQAAGHQIDLQIRDRKISTSSDTFSSFQKNGDCLYKSVFWIEK